MRKWYHQLSRHEFEQSLGDSKRQGSDEVVADLNLGLLQSMVLQRVGHDLVTEQQYVIYPGECSMCF